MRKRQAPYVPNIRSIDERIIRENHKRVCFKGVDASADEIKDMHALICVQKTSVAKREQIATSDTIMESISKENAHIVKNLANRVVEK